MCCHKLGVQMLVSLPVSISDSLAGSLQGSLFGSLFGWMTVSGPMPPLDHLSSAIPALTPFLLVSSGGWLPAFISPSMHMSVCTLTCSIQQLLCTRQLTLTGTGSTDQEWSFTAANIKSQFTF